MANDMSINLDNATGTTNHFKATGVAEQWPATSTTPETSIAFAGQGFFNAPGSASASEQHLESEFADYEQRFPKE